MSIEKYQLSNKAKLLLVPVADTKSVTVLVIYPIGSRYESSDMGGVSHFIEHLLFKGTKKRPSTLELTKEIDRWGAEYNAFTGKEYTGYYIKINADYLPVALDILADMQFNSLFSEKEMEKEKGVICEELRMYKDNPLMNIDNIFEQLMYSSCCLGNDVGGTVESVQKMSRLDLLSYHSLHYHPANMTVVIAGNVEKDTDKLVSKYFNKQLKQKFSDIKYSPAVFGPGNHKDRVAVEKKQTDQTQLMLGFPGLNHQDKRDAVLSVLNTILGGSMSSRLFIQIREKRGLAYMVRSGSENYRDSGYVYVRAGLEAKNINKAMKVVNHELEKMKEKGVSKQELKDAKTHIGGSLVLSLENSGFQAQLYAFEALFKKQIETPEQWLARINQVTNEDIKALASNLFKTEKMRVAVIGDIEKEQIKF